MENRDEGNAGVTGTVYYDPEMNTASWVGPNPVCLSLHQVLSVSFTGFPAGSQLNEIILRERNHGFVIRWIPGQTILGDIFSVSLGPEDAELDQQQLTIRDQEDPPQEAHRYSLGMHGVAGPKKLKWSIDPEVINQPGHTGPGKPKAEVQSVARAELRRV